MPNPFAASKTQSVIHWFPGHMNKARRELGERLGKSDLVIELLDARAPRASKNPMLERLRGALPCLKLLTKADLADPVVTELWLRELVSEGTLALAVTTSDRGLGDRLARLSRQLCPDRPRPGFPVRALIVGIPNVGKSTLFNTLLGKRKANVENRPAVTRRQQHAEVGPGLFIVDTPGLLWPKLEDQRGAACLCALGSLGEAAFEPVVVARFALTVLVERYPEAVSARYGMANLDDPSGALLDRIGKKRGCLVRGGEVDLGKAAAIVLGDLREGRLGRISLELPSDPTSEKEPADDAPELAIADPAIEPRRG